MEREGKTPEKLLEEADLLATGVPEPEGGLKLIVDLVGDQDEDEPKIDERAKRRRTRRSLLDEVDDLVPDAAEAEEHRLAKERARKGKAAATSSTRSRKAPSVKEVEETLSPMTEDPSVEEQDEPDYESEEAE